MTLSEVLLSALLSLPLHTEDRAPEHAEAKRAQLTTLAAAIADASDDQSITRPRDWAALIIAIGYAESSFSLRIHVGLCKPHECDRGRARGPWQLHRYAEATPVWDKMTGIENAGVQAAVASARLARGFYTCRTKGDWLTATINGFAGRRCDLIWPGLERRVAVYHRVRKAINK